jgi:hypothetical protein
MHKNEYFADPENAQVMEEYEETFMKDLTTKRKGIALE